MVILTCTTMCAVGNAQVVIKIQETFVYQSKIVEQDIFGILRQTIVFQDVGLMRDGQGLPVHVSKASTLLVESAKNVLLIAISTI